MLAIYFKEFHDHFGAKTDDPRYRPPDPWFTDSGSSASSTPTDDGPFLQCALCHDRYNKPKVLPCLHTFCQGCLLQQTPKDSLTLTCPICRHQSILPRNGVFGLQDNVIVSNFVNLLEMPKTEELHPIVRVKNYSEKKTIELPPIEESAVEQKSHLKNLLTKVSLRIPILKEDIQNISLVVSQLKENHLETKSKMLHCLEDLENTLKERKIELVEELDRVHQEKFKVLQEQKHVLEMCLLNLEDHCQYTEDVLNRGSDEELNILYYDLAEKLEDFVATNLQNEPKENVFLVCDNNGIEEVENKLKSLEVVKTCKASPSESSLKAEQSMECKMGDSLSWTLIIRDGNGSPMIVEDSAKKIVLTNSDQEEFEVKIIENENKSYTINWTAIPKGTYTLITKLYGQHVTGSPQLITCKGMEKEPQNDTKREKCKIMTEEDANLYDHRVVESSQLIPVSDIKEEEQNYDEVSSCEHFDGQVDNDLLMKIGRRGRSKGEFTNLQGVCCTKEGRIIASDSNNQCVQVFDKNGKFLIRFGGRGRGPGQMQRPTGITISPNGNYLVADYELRVVNVFKPEGQYCRRFGSGKLLGPRGLLFTKDGKLLVVDSKANCIYVMQDSKILGKIGSPGSGKGRFSGPHYIALDSLNRVIVTDFHNHSVHIYTLDGNHVTTFGSKGEGNGQFNAPTGIAVDSQDNIIVADWGNNRVQIFDSNGSFLSFINTSTDPLYGPQDLALTPEGYIIVADSGSYCLKIYKYLQ
ncbi:tripartite motif-containing protein 3-like [Centruroides sculpturatus]|uniref:tripartite motif-containing protein 3-like n=1 Tax=Centruroides sculpturatus TaxID=218467 RepID=UPI000C6E27FA|nr:tripartite motif-containing protein 3-like [Centruroides sculpturatus]